jgi:2-dehydro-3-deoxygluconokinase
VSRRGTVVTLGEALVSVVPTEAVPLSAAPLLTMHVGGAELNFAIGLRRLGMPTAWVGRVGDDPFGCMVVDTLEREGVDTRWVRADGDVPTGVYFREWLTDGRRRPYYYRAGSAATRLDQADVPSVAEADMSWLHVSGITPALGSAPRAAVAEAVARAAAAGVPVSFDPNYRPALWSPEDARAELLPLARAARVLLMSQQEAALLFGVPGAEAALARAHAEGIETAVVKLAADGAVASVRGGAPVHAPAAAVRSAPDPVGAGDGFDAGFVAALLAGADVQDALAVGIHVGARAVEQVGEHPYPRAAELPPHLAAAVGAGTSAMPTATKEDR